MTPGELADKLDKVPPGFGWNKLVDLLYWQEKKGKKLLNIAWYAETAYRDFYKRERVGPKAEANKQRLSELTGGVG